MPNPERREIAPGIAEECTDGYDPDWKPGDPDPNIDRVYVESEPGKPGITKYSELVDIGGVIMPRRQALILGLID